MRWPAVLLAAVAALVLASPADAARFGGQKWPTRTITYHVAAPQYEGAIQLATLAWNRSGVKIRFKRIASRRRAALHIIYGHRGGPSGRATLGYRSRSTYVGSLVNGRRYRGPVRCGGRVRKGGKLRKVRCLHGAHVFLDHVSAKKLADPYQRNYMVIAATHELGHVLGLRHRKNRCAVMSYQREDACPKPPAPWQLRCRPLERDDVKGAIMRYGGRRKPLAPAFCNSYQPAQPPVGVTAGVDQFGRLVVRWSLGAGAVRAWISVQANTCATAPQYTVDREYIQVHPPGRYCVTLWGVDAQGRQGPATTLAVTVPAGRALSRRAPDPPTRLRPVRG